MEVIKSDFFFNLCRFHKYKYHSKLEWLDLYRSAVKTILNKNLLKRYILFFFLYKNSMCHEDYNCLKRYACYVQSTKYATIEEMAKRKVMEVKLAALLFSSPSLLWGLTAKNRTKQKRIIQVFKKCLFSCLYHK